MTSREGGTTFVVPVLNGAGCLPATLDSIFRQADRQPIEILVVDDGSTDASLELLESHRRAGRLQLFRGEGRGAAAAINLGIRRATLPFIAQVDQDVVLGPGWLADLVMTLEREPQLAAAQGYYATTQSDSLWARVTGLDLELRYAVIPPGDVDHVCTGNTLYRRQSLVAVGFFDETLGYGYDNDMSYRLQLAGHRLGFCRTARSQHRWRPTLAGYLRQQYGLGYGRLDVVRKHPRRVRGDQVSDLRMMLHAPTALASVALLLAAGAAFVTAGIGRAPLALALLLGGILLFDRLVAATAAWRRFRDPAVFMFPLAHLLRDLAWSWAILRWSARAVVGARARPQFSMLRSRR